MSEKWWRKKAINERKQMTTIAGFPAEKKEEKQGGKKLPNLVAREPGEKRTNE